MMFFRSLNEMAVCILFIHPKILSILSKKHGSANRPDHEARQGEGSSGKAAGKHGRSGCAQPGAGAGMGRLLAQV